MKEKPSTTLSPLRGFVPGPSQLLCLPKGLDTVAQLHLQAPDTSLERSQSRSRKLPREPITIDTFPTSSLPGLSHKEQEGTTQKDQVFSLQLPVAEDCSKSCTKVVAATHIGILVNRTWL